MGDVLDREPVAVEIPPIEWRWVDHVDAWTALCRLEGGADRFVIATLYMARVPVGEVVGAQLRLSDGDVVPAVAGYLHGTKVTTSEAVRWYLPSEAIDVVKRRVERAAGAR